MLRREAARWLARLQSKREPDVERKFARWRDSDPRNAEAFDRVSESYQRAGLLRHSQAASAAAPPAVAKHATRWAAPPSLAAMAAMLVLVAAAVLLVRGGLSTGGTDAVILMTSVEEIREVGLADGSTVTLDTGTRVDVDVGRSHRSARIKYGRARFRVAQAKVPFVIEGGTATITSREAVIDVEQTAGRDRVHVLAGTAELRSNQAESSVAVRAGQSATADAGGVAGPISAAAAPDWTMLQFDAAPLGEAVAAANRYSKRRIVLTGDLGALRVTGAFRAGDTAALARALAQAFDLSLRSGAEGELILSRQPSSVPPKKTGG